MPTLLLQKLLNLVALDQKSSSYTNKINEYIAEIDGLQRQIATLQTNFAKHQVEQLAQKRAVDLIELNLSELDAAEAEKKRAAEMVKNQREYQAITKEIEILSASRIDQEEALVSAWHSLEQTTKKIDVQKAMLEEQTTTLQKKIIALGAEISLQEQELRALLEQRSTLTSALTPELLKRYEAMKGKVPNPIVPLQNKSCSGCYYLALAQDVTRMLKGELINCRNCYRLLFYTQETEAQAQEASY